MTHSYADPSDWRNPVKPCLGTICGVRDLATGIKLFQVEPDDPEVRANSNCGPGRFAEVSALGVGESLFGIVSTRQRSTRRTRRRQTIDVAINRIGTVTGVLHRMDVGDKVGVRGPLGNGLPMDQFKGKDIVILGVVLGKLLVDQ